MKVEERFVDAELHRAVDVHLGGWGGWMRGGGGAYEWIGMIGWIDTGMDRWRDKRMGRCIDGG